MSEQAGRSSIGAVVSLLALGALLAMWQFRPQPKVEVQPLAVGVRLQSENHYSPAENLERLDVEQLEKAQRSVDVAMYAFTDKFVAEELARLGQRGVVVRIYRDREQYEQEQRNAAQHRDLSTSDLLRGAPNVSVRVKRSSRRDLMHLKAYLIDRPLLRDGSANWSPAGLKAQDNNAHYTNDPAQVRAFEQAFEEMWAREDNERVQ